MKSLALLFFLASPVQSQKVADWAPQFQTKFCGLDTLHDSAYLEDCDAQSAQNVLTDRGYLEERPGMTRLFTEPGAIKQLYEFIDPSNTRWLIAHVGNTVYKTNLSGNAVFLSTVSAGNNLECTSIFGTLICDDGAGAMWSFNGTSSTTIQGGAPICTFLASQFGRVFCGAPSTDLSQVAISSFGGSGYWIPSTIVPLPANSATTWEFNQNDGDSIQCMKVTPWGLFVGKKNSSYVLKGYDNNTFYSLTVDPVIGCSDQRTVQMVNGLLTWASQKGVYQWPGNGPPVWISEKIDPTYRQIRQLSANSNFWEIQTQADWQTGSISLNNNLPSWDTTSQPGYIIPSSSTIFATPSVSSMTWAQVDVDTTIVPASNFVSNQDGASLDSIWRVTQGSVLNVNHSATGDNSSPAVAAAVINQSTGVWSFIFNSTASQGGGNIFEFWIISSNTVSAGSLDNGYTFRIFGTQYDITCASLVAGCGGGGNLTLISTVTSINAFDGNDHAYRITRSTNGYMEAYADGIFIASSTNLGAASPMTYSTIKYDAQGSKMHVKNVKFPNFYQYQESTPYAIPYSTALFYNYTVALTSASNSSVTFNMAFATSTNGPFGPLISQTPGSLINVSFSSNTVFRNEYVLSAPSTGPIMSVGTTTVIVVSTGIFYSPVHSVGSAITSWKQIVFQDLQQTPGELQYYVRSANSFFTVQSATPAWAAQTNNQTVVAPLNTPVFFQYKIDSSSITSSSEAITLANASVAKSIVNWQEGTSVKPASGFMDQRYFLCVTLSTSDMTNDGCLIWQRNQQWTLLNGPSIAAMSPFNFQLIGGDSSSNGRVWYMMQDGVYDDDGSVIVSSWTSKDFIIGSPFNQKVFYEVWLDNNFNNGSTLNVGWAMDKNPIFTQKTINLDATGTGAVSGPNNSVTRVFPNKGYELGKYVRFNFSNNSLDLPWRLNSWLFYVDVQTKQAQ